MPSVPEPNDLTEQYQQLTYFEDVLLSKDVFCMTVSTPPGSICACHRVMRSNEGDGRPIRRMSKGDGADLGSIDLLGGGGLGSLLRSGAR